MAWVQLISWRLVSTSPQWDGNVCHMNRRAFQSSLLLGAAGLPLLSSLRAQDAEARPPARPIGVCDWTMGKRHSLDAFDLAKKLGLEGVQVSFGEPGSAIDLRKADHRKQLFERASETGVRVASLGMAVLNQKPYASHADAEIWVADAVDVVAAMKKEFPDAAPSVVLLAFFGKGDVNGKPEGMTAVIKRLKKVAPKAEEAGVVFGIESLLSKDDHLKIIDGVGSTSVQVYYDTANSNRMGYDIYKEVRELGAERICEIHCKENGNRISEGDVDFPKFKAALDDIDYKGWLILEGSKVKGNKLEDDYQANRDHLFRVFRGADK